MFLQLDIIQEIVTLMNVLLSSVFMSLIFSVRQNKAKDRKKINPCTWKYYFCLFVS